MSNTARQPPFTFALAAALAASAAQSWLAVLLASLTRHVDAHVYYVASCVVGGWALRLMLDAIGYEINAFAHLAAKAKIDCIDVSPKSFRAKLQRFRSTMAAFESEVDRKWTAGGVDALEDAVATLRAGSTIDFRSRIPFFAPPVEAKFRYALSLTATLDSPYSELFRAALGGTMVSYSNYTYEPSLSSRPGAGKPLIENASVAIAVCGKLEMMAEDIQLVQARHGSWAERHRDVILRSYFDSELRHSSVSLIVTSPPYMNNYHYVRNTRPQLHWLGLLREKSAFKTYEHESFGKFWQTVRQGEAQELCFDFPALEALVHRVRGLNLDRGQYGGPGWANYVVTYFNDCERFVRLVKRHLRRGARAVIVVGNSIIQGVEFKVDELLAEVAEISGLKVDDVRIVRNKRVGSSIIDSSVRNGNRAATKLKTRLYDAAVILKA